MAQAKENDNASLPLPSFPRVSFRLRQMFECFSAEAGDRNGERQYGHLRFYKSFRAGHDLR